MSFDDIRRTRLGNEYEEMQRIQDTPVVSWIAEKGEPPFVEEYLVTFHVRTYISPDTTTNRCQLRIVLPERYPLESPVFTVVGTPVFNPAFFTNGQLGSYRYYPGYTLVDFLEYIFYLLQYCDECIDCNSFSNSEAGLWYRHNKDKPGLFPCDDKEFPFYRELFEEETDTMPGEELSEAPASTFSAPGGSAEGEDDASLSTMDLLYS
ncbi:MAG: hypothetical protein ABS876_01485 [Ruminococcus sp.]